MLEEQYEAIMDLHGNWIDKAIEEVAQSKGADAIISAREFFRGVRGAIDIPDGLNALQDWHLLSVIERRLEMLTGIGRLQDMRMSSHDISRFKVLDVLDALAAL